ncbi:hypothetical protein F5890DRAFT_1559529 [Lentinula detonsa]|uniref:Uncharacterized protein n=1 Tax=Lentinula detonsa TaxID=2804962 RepID=A0AA38UMN3_9AGAR|nr:hypothetical protein F5890DRAFT_1559529 [Lentinula detonsa]
MSSSQKSQGRRKFDVSLAELSRPEKQTHHYKTYKPPDLPSKAASKSHSEELTPQQEARKRYEERNLLQRRKKARERMAKYVVIFYSIILILGLSDAERRTAKKNEKFRKLTKNCIAKDIEKSVGTRRIDAVLCESHPQPDELLLFSDISKSRYIEQYGAKSFHLYLRRRNGHLQRPEDYEEASP